MKRFSFILLLLCLLLSSCAPASPATQAAAQSSASASSKEPSPSSSAGDSLSAPPASTQTPPPQSTEEAIDPQWVFHFTADELPIPTKNDGFDRLRQNRSRLIMDGSTSLIPMETALLSALMDLSEADARAQVDHTTTWDSFHNLLSGDRNLIFSCPLSPEQREMAKDVPLVEVPLAMEAFVFVVNAKNPVNTLSQQQLRDIYSGKITNWKQVGGPDAAIVAYQRNADSGSQNYMQDFMGDTPLTDAPTGLRPGTMEGLMEAVAVNDNSLYSIGYSVYAYAADMYQNGEAVKFIRVDGVGPSHQSINDRSYPLLGYNYLIYREDSPNADLLKEFSQYALSEEAQLALAKARYVPVQPIDFDFATLQPRRYEGIGQGPQAPEVLSSFYYEGKLKLAPLRYSLNDKEYTLPQITNLANLPLQEEINAYLRDSLKEVVKSYPLLLRKKQNAAIDYTYSSPSIQCTLEERNGYLSACVSLEHGYSPYGTDGYLASFVSECAVWDLVNAKRLSFEECFVKGTDVDELLNSLLNEKSLLPYDSWGQLYPLKSEFSSLEKGFDWAKLAIDAIRVEDDNPFFASGVVLRCNLDAYVWNIQRENRACFSADSTLQKNLHLDNAGGVTGLHLDSYAIPMLTPDQSPHAETINEAVLSYMRKSFSDVESNHFNDWRGRIFGNRYYQVSATGYSDHASRGEYRNLLFDLHTGKELRWQEILSKDWKEYATSFQIQEIQEGYTLFMSLACHDEAQSLKIHFGQWDPAGLTEYDGYIYENDSLTLTIPYEDLIF